MTVPELCALTHNFFDRADDPIAGEFAFEPDTVPAGVVPGQYFLVCGSIFNDGVHKAGDGDLVAETFNGTVQPMRVPPALPRWPKKSTHTTRRSRQAACMCPSPSAAGPARWLQARTGCPPTVRPSSGPKSTSGGRCDMVNPFVASTVMQGFTQKYRFQTRSYEPDGVGGFVSGWTDGPEFEAVERHDTTVEAQVAEQAATASTYTLLVNTGVPLAFPDYVKRVSDGQTFQVTSAADEGSAPEESGMGLRAVKCKKAVLP